MGIIKALAKKIILGSSRHLGLYAVASLSVMTVSLSTMARNPVSNRYSTIPLSPKKKQFLQKSFPRRARQ